MKSKLYFTFYLLLSLFCLQSCNPSNDQTENKNTTTTLLSGKFIRVDQLKIETLSDMVGGVGLIPEITFYTKNCEFSYVGLQMSGTYTIESDKIFINAGGQIGNLSMTIINENRLQGGGFINGVFIKENTDEVNIFIEEQKKIAEQNKDIYITTKRTVLRAGPGNEFAASDTVQEGLELKAEDWPAKEEDWLMVKSKETKAYGWCKKKFLKKK